MSLIKIYFLFSQRKISFILVILFAFGCMVCGSAVAQPLRRLQNNGAYGKPNLYYSLQINFNCDDFELVCSNRSVFPNLNKLNNKRDIFFSVLFG
jgi:hypothetical protein